MAKSRTSNKTKSKKSKFPMWGIAIIVVAVIVVAGYAIVRFSKAGGCSNNFCSLSANVETYSFTPAFATCKKSQNTAYGLVYNVNIIAARPMVKDGNLVTKIGADVLRPNSNGGYDTISQARSSSWLNNTTSAVAVTTSAIYKDKVKVIYFTGSQPEGFGYTFNTGFDPTYTVNCK